MPAHPRIPLLVAPFLFAALALAGCAGAGTPVGPSPVDTSAEGPSDSAAEEAPAVPASYSAGPECDAYVAAKNASLASANQQAVQVSVDELPFAVDSYGVLCVDAVYTLDAPEPTPLGFEVLADAVDGIGYNVFAMSPDLTYQNCTTSDPMGCFTDAAGNLVVVGASDAALEFFPDLNAIVIAGVHMIGD